MNEEQKRLDALKLAITTVSTGATSEEILDRAKAFFAFIMNNGNESPE